MNNVGIIGYAHHCKSGEFLQEMMKETGIKHHLAVYNYRKGGFANDMVGFDTYLNGCPQDKTMSGRWQWELQPDMFRMWCDNHSLTHVILVGSVFGSRTVQWTKLMHLKSAIVELWDAYPPDLTGLEFDMVLTPDEKMSEPIALSYAPTKSTRCVRFKYPVTDWYVLKMDLRRWVRG